MAKGAPSENPADPQVRAAVRAARALADGGADEEVFDQLKQAFSGQETRNFSPISALSRPARNSALSWIWGQSAISGIAARNRPACTRRLTSRGRI